MDNFTLKLKGYKIMLTNGSSLFGALKIDDMTTKLVSRFIYQRLTVHVLEAENHFFS